VGKSWKYGKIIWEKCGKSRVSNGETTTGGSSHGSCGWGFSIGQSIALGPPGFLTTGMDPYSTGEHNLILGSQGTRDFVDISRQKMIET